MKVKKFWINTTASNMPEGYTHIKSVDEAIRQIEYIELVNDMIAHPEKYGGVIEDEPTSIAVICLSFDAMENRAQGGHYINLLKYFENRGIPCPYSFYLTTALSQFLQAEREIINRNGWTELALPLDYAEKRFANRDEFPKGHGARGILYVDESTGACYIWDTEVEEYIIAPLGFMHK